MCSIRTGAQVHMIVHYPETEEGKYQLAQRVAGIHADMVSRYIQKLNCPSGQKVKLLDAVITSTTNSYL